VKSFCAVHLKLTIPGEFRSKWKRRKTIDHVFQPFEHEIIAELDRKDPGPSGWKINWVTQPASPDANDRAIHENIRRMDRLREEWIDFTGFKRAPSPDDPRLKQLALRAPTLFYDTEFPPTKRSLGENRGTKDGRAIILRHIRDILPRPKLFHGEVSANDVQQGSLGNCWLCCSISSCALADRGKRIERILNDVNMDRGFFKIRMLVDGLWQDIVIDGFLPCAPYGDPVYMGIRGGAVWAALVEKAFAKRFGSYNALVGGHCMTALVDLTGCPTVHTPKLCGEPESDIWRKLQKWTRRKWLLGADMPSGEEIELANGLVRGHAYSILGIKEQAGMKLVKIRNPWGRGSYSGLPHQERYRSSIRNRQTETDGDGTFWMRLKEFRDEFDSMSACAVNDSDGREWREARMEGEVRMEEEGGIRYASGTTFGLEVPRGGACEWIGLYQRDKREEGRDLDGRNVCIGLVIESEERAVVAFVGGNTDSRYFEEVSLRPGRYTITAVASGINMERRAGHFFAMSVHCSSSCVRTPSLRKVDSYYSHSRLHNLFRDVLFGLGKVRRDEGPEWDVRMYSYQHGDLFLAGMAVGRKHEAPTNVTWLRVQNGYNTDFFAGFKRPAKEVIVHQPGDKFLYDLYARDNATKAWKFNAPQVELARTQRR